MFKDKTSVFDLEVLYSHNEIVWLSNSGMMWITGKRVRKKSFGGTFCFKLSHNKVRYGRSSVSCLCSGVSKISNFFLWEVKTSNWKYYSTNFLQNVTFTS
jgi:hypothetical protein